MDVRLEQAEKAFATLVILAGIRMLVNFEHRLNARAPMVVILLGSVMSDRLVQEKKAQLPMLTTPPPTVTSVRLVHE